MPDRDRTIIAKYPDLFDLDSCPTGSLMHLGLQVDSGWLPVIEQLCTRIEPIAPADFRIVAVKQDMGTLRIAYRDGTDAIYIEVEAARRLAARTCEFCGGPGVQRTVGGWMSVRCESCGG